MTIGTGKFERMTKEEKLRFCQDLIKKAANLTKSSAINDIYSTENISSLSDIHSKSKSNQQPMSVSSILSKETKNDTSKLHATKQTPSTSHMSRRNKSKSKQETTQRSSSKSSLLRNKSNVIQSSSDTNNKSEMKNAASNTLLANSPKTTKTRSKSKSQKTKTRTNKLKSTTKKKITSNVRSKSKRSTIANKTNITNTKNKSKSNTRSETHQTKQPHKTNKNPTETCTIQFVPKFNPNSNKNQVPIYHLVRHAFGNMVREAICQLDKDKIGVSSKQIIDHIIKHYTFPNNISENVVRNRAMFTINSGLRAGTLLTVSPNQGVRIGRMRHNYTRMLC
ncbi:unnamed protein product [Rotaria sordida]|uniref:Uncharacterized protein n=1 Tax=Rotaria sordida TaxID=392033 RepID=A0A818YQH2_9BILA|nr:unnamed protein product [Rotaria sordida]CAF1275052.1 unnamed protein product [Rotaria sordida]CAF3698768.1 unnamed protein product [Rotaria sordida]CAF3757596.1 unnamed protein product [Rotaria sordida]